MNSGAFYTTEVLEHVALLRFIATELVHASRPRRPAL
jgi:hypothetical protein